MSASIARFLKDFGEPEAPAVPTTDSPDFGMGHLGDFAGFEAEPEVSEPLVDLEAVKAAAIEEGRALATAELTAKFEEEKLQLISENTEIMSKMREDLLTELGQTLAGQISASMDALATFFADHCLAVLTPVLSEELAKRASQDLAVLVNEAMRDNECVKIGIRGQRPMFDALIAALGENAPEIQFVETDDADLSVEVGDSVVVTRMSAWASSLRKVIQ